MVEELIKKNFLKTKWVIDVMKRVDRGDFLMQSEGKYLDRPQYLGFGATISAPHMHAFALVFK